MPDVNNLPQWAQKLIDGLQRHNVNLLETVETLKSQQTENGWATLEYGHLVEQPQVPVNPLQISYCPTGVRHHEC